MDIRKPATGNTTTMERLGNSTYYSVQHWRNNLASGGIVGGGVISDAGGGTINVTAGQCAIRPTASHTSTLYFADFPAAIGLAIPTDTIRYVGVEYNAGSPIVALRTADNFDYMTSFPIGVVTNEAGTLHLATADLHDVSDSASHVAERFEHTTPFARDEVIGGIVIGETGTRNITMSAGAMWQKLRKLTISAFNSSTGGTFDIYYRAVSGFTKVAAQTQWPNTQYDDGTGTLATLGANKYAVLWFYLEPDDSNIMMLYGRGEYNGIAAAEAESPPATVPNRITAGGKIVAKLIFQKSAATATSIYSVFTTVFSTTGASNHANLSNLDYASAGHTGFQSTLTNSAGLAAALSDETGTGLAVFNNSPSLITPALGTPASGDLRNCSLAVAPAIGGTTPAAGAFTALSVSGDVTLTGMVVPTTNNVSFRSSLSNTTTRLYIYPNGTASNTGFRFFAQDNVVDNNFIELLSGVAGVIFRTNKTGAGVIQPMQFQVGGAIIMELAAAGTGVAVTGGISATGSNGIGTTNPTARLHLPAGTATASTAPAKFTLSGAALLTTPEAGAMEPDSSGNLFFTTSDVLRTPVNKQYVLASKLGANFNITTDQSITIPAGRWVIRKIVVNNASISLTTAAGGVYTGANKTGTTIVGAAQVYTALTASGKYLDLTLDAAMATDILTATTIYFSLTTAQGAAATGDIFIIGDRLDY